MPIALHEERRWGAYRHDQIEFASRKNCANVFYERRFILGVLDPGGVERDLMRSMGSGDFLINSSRKLAAISLHGEYA